MLHIALQVSTLHFWFVLFDLQLLFPFSTSKSLVTHKGISLDYNKWIYQYIQTAKRKKPASQEYNML